MQSEETSQIKSNPEEEEPRGEATLFSEISYETNVVLFKYKTGLLNVRK